jgi:hypothetical protein
MRILETLLYLQKTAKKKKKKKKGPFHYEGESFSTNPFAVCNKNISKKEEPEKWEKCVHHVKDKSKS